MLNVFSILFYFRPFSPHFWGVVTYTSGSSIIYSVYIYMHLYLGAWLSWLLMQSGGTVYPVSCMCTNPKFSCQVVSMWCKNRVFFSLSPSSHFSFSPLYYLKNCLLMKALNYAWFYGIFLSLISLWITCWWVVR